MQKLETISMIFQQLFRNTQRVLATALSGIWFGHGIGTHLHEDPEVPNFAQKRKGIRLEAGMTLAVEPMITAGRYDVVWMDDDWTVVTDDGSLAAHYENTILITDGEPEILSLL